MWQSIASSMWTVIESNLGIIVACMPALRPLIVRFFPLLLGKIGRTTARESKKNKHDYYEEGTAASKVSKPRDKYDPHGTAVSQSWLDNEPTYPSRVAKPQAYVDNHHYYDLEEMENVSDGDRESDDHILSGRHEQSQQGITKTTEYEVRTAQGPAGAYQRY
jgi:hypothetical protein